MQLKYLTSCVPCLIKLKKCKFENLLKSFEIMKYTNRIEEYLVYYNEEVTKIFNAYGERRDDGDMHIKKEHLEEYSKEIKKLEEFETNIDKSNITITIGELEEGYPNSNAWFTIEELKHLNDLFVLTE